MPSTETPIWRSDQGTLRREAAGSEGEVGLEENISIFWGGVVSLHERGALLSEEIKLNKKVPNNIVACHSHAGIFIVLYLAGVQRKRYNNKEIICRNRSGKDMISFSKYGFVS